MALQDVVWPGYSRGRWRMAAAFFFGLFHGLGFAGGLLDLMREMPGETPLSAILGFSAGVETGHFLILVPLFGLLAAARCSQRDPVKGSRRAMACQRIGSTGILVAGVYYLGAALAIAP